MTAPSNANTSGLEVSLAAVLARAICESEGKDWAALDNTREDVERWFRLGEVTAASAQAKIAELRNAYCAAESDAMTLRKRATAAEARADRLAKALKRAADDLRDIGTQKPQPTNSPDPEHENYLRRVLISLGQVGNARARAALQQETQP